MKVIESFSIEQIRQCEEYFDKAYQYYQNKGEFEDSFLTSFPRIFDVDVELPGVEYEPVTEFGFNGISPSSLVLLLNNQDKIMNIVRGKLLSDLREKIIIEADDNSSYPYNVLVKWYYIGDDSRRGFKKAYCYFVSLQDEDSLPKILSGYVELPNGETTDLTIKKN